jgi:phosphoglycolate phosphatase-like HAD superfamily hydrolase
MIMARLLLFDIDGTLVRGGPAKGAFELAMRTVYGTAGPVDGHNFSGKTDPQIARELLRLAGFDDGGIDERMEALWEVYLGELEARLDGLPMTVLPGVVALLDHLRPRRDVALGLLTGNIVDGARLKLGSVGLFDYFVAGGFGSDSEARGDLPAVAIGRAQDALGIQFPASEVVVVGDTPRDVACGRQGGTRTVAVATGRYGLEELSAAGADVVLSDLSLLDTAVGALLDGRTEG